MARGICAQCGTGAATEHLEAFSEGLRCRDGGTCAGRVAAAQALVAGQLAEVAASQMATRDLRPGQAQQLQEEFGLSMSDLELTPVRLRDATLRYRCLKAGQEGRVFVWQTVGRHWEVEEPVVSATE